MRVLDWPVLSLTTADGFKSHVLRNTRRRILGSKAYGGVTGYAMDLLFVCLKWYSAGPKSNCLIFFLVSSFHCFFHLFNPSILPRQPVLGHLLYRPLHHRPQPRTLPPYPIRFQSRTRMKYSPFATWKRLSARKCVFVLASLTTHVFQADSTILGSCHIVGSRAAAHSQDSREDTQDGPSFGARCCAGLSAGRH